jgi:hypothetical protein
MDNEIEAFRKEIARWRGGRRQGARRYPEEMRSTALRLWDRLRHGGATDDAAAKKVGITAVTLQLWREGKSAKRLVPVRLISETATPVAALRVVRMLSPSGYRIEVPDVATAAELLRAVG